MKGRTNEPIEFSLADRSRGWSASAARWLLTASAALFVFAMSLACAAQDEVAPRLIDQAPFDRLTLDAMNDSKVLKIYPVPLPGRRVPEKPKAGEKLRIKLLETSEEFDVEWVHIAKLEFYEQMVLAEINQLGAAGRLDDAYDALVFLLTYYPNTSGLSEARQHYLYLSSAAAFRQQKYEEALAILEELWAFSPSYRPPGENAPPLVQRLSEIADRQIGHYVERQDYRSARALLARLVRQYKADNEAFAKKWRTELESRAATRRDEARAHLAAGRFVEAQDACAAMQMIWPDVSGAGELASQIARLHPIVRVAVEHPALVFDAASLENMAARRAGRLTQRLLVECTGLGAEGGKYQSPLATVSHGDDSRSLVFQMQPAAGTNAGYELARWLLSQAAAGEAANGTNWSQLVASVGLPAANLVRVELRTPHVLPESLVSPALSKLEFAAAASQPYSQLSRDKSVTRFATVAGYAFLRPGQPAEVIERHFADPQAALLALKRGEVEALDRIFPGDIAALKSDSGLAASPYAGPTTHVLAVRSSQPFLASRTFRRALLYGANRELLLNQGLLRGANQPGFRVVSGPFPAPIAGMELPIYGYDTQIEPRPYDPRLALTLRLVSETEVKATLEKQEQKYPGLLPLVLGHPADETSRIACRGLAKNWKAIGIECQLVEFPPGVFDDDKEQCDLVYLQLAAWEPVRDARRLFGPGGLIPVDSDAVRLAQRELERARNWQEVRQRLLVLHRLLHEEATLLPLWQTLDHYAYRRTLAGLSPRRVSLYQDIEQWRAATQVARSQP